MNNPFKSILALGVSIEMVAYAQSALAQNANATISEIPAGGGEFAYTITLHNTGTSSLNGFWYGWTQDGNNLPDNPTDAGNSLGWDNDLAGNSIMWQNSSGTALASGQSATFTFESTSTLSAITASPSGESVAYVGEIDGSQGSAGDSTGVFSPVASVPEPSPMALMSLGVLIMASAARRVTTRGHPPQ